jgi:hypothetical protein
MFFQFLSSPSQALPTDFVDSTTGTEVELAVQREHGDLTDRLW